MVEGGATVIAVEHNQQVIAASDWVVELGPGGGGRCGAAVGKDAAAQLGAQGVVRQGDGLLHRHGTPPFMKKSPARMF